MSQLQELNDRTMLGREGTRQLMRRVRQALQQKGNPNLLLNWDFRNPVNRNGKVEYRGVVYQWTIDRWRFNDGIRNVLTIKDGYITLSETDTTTSWKEVSQLINDADGLIGETLTYSLLARASKAGCSTLIVYKYETFNRIDVPVSTDWNLVTYTFVVPPDVEEGAFRVGLQIQNTVHGAELDVMAAKLELGSTQTLARQNEDGEWEVIDPPDYNLQYLLCSQYSPTTGEWVGSQHSNPNLLINSYWGSKASIINQRGQDEYTGNTYTIDMWWFSQATSATKATLDDDSLSITFQNNETFGQNIENYLPLVGKTLTASFLTSDNQLLTATAIFPASGSAVVSTNYNGSPFEFFFQSINGGRVFLHNAYGAVNISFVAAKLELGPIQTLAHKEGDTWVLNDPPPNYQQELAKCQRYQVFGDMHASPLTVEGSDSYCLLPLPTTLRAKPTLVGTPYARDANNNPTAGTISVGDLNANGVTLRVQGASKLVYVYGTFGLDANL